MSDLKRKATVKRSAGGSKPKKDISIVKQGIKQLYPEKDSFSPEIDIVLVPGLGAHPKECWETKDFKWPTDSLAKDFPKSRILLYMYESAWQGALKVEQFMDNLAKGLLVAIDACRAKKDVRRPIVFIGHSMGGLIVAKAVTIADSDRKSFPIMFEAIAAAIFFGTPFKGAAAASVASMYAAIAEKLDQAISSELLDFMKPGNSQLRELVDQFTRLVGKVEPSIRVLCFFEERDTDLSSLAKLPGILPKIPLPTKLAKFVTRESATLEVSEKLGLAANHRDLVKFESAQEPHFQMVRREIKERINAAGSIVKARMNAVRDIDRDMINAIDDALEAPYIAGKRKALAEAFSPSSWITKEPEYITWLAESTNGDEYDAMKPGDCLWVRAPEGRGKTSASLAVISDFEQREVTNRNQDPVLLAYFFCDQSSYFCTAEDVLKSLLRQLIKQQETLAHHAKSFIKKAKGEKSQAQITIENLWQALQDMLADSFIGSKVIFVLNNLHVLPETSASTIKLMTFLKTELLDMNEMGPRRVTTRWFITSRETHNVGSALDVDGVRLIDLEDEKKYGNQVQIALRRIAKSKVESLVIEKNYSKALAYFVSSLIGKRAQNTQWIEISCVQLYELPEAESDVKVRRVLETMPQDLRALLNNAWHQVFRANSEECDKIKEMLRTLVLTYEDPTEQELGVLAGLCSSDEEMEELHGLVEMCKPLLIKDTNGTVSFMNVVVKSHLLENAKDVLGMSMEEIKWQHGVLALRCFEHVKEAFDVDIDLETDPEQQEQPVHEEVSAYSSGGNQEYDVANEYDGESRGDAGEDDIGNEDGAGNYGNANESDGSFTSSEESYDSEADEVQDLAMAYTVKHWLRHASKATFDIAEDLSVEQDFWMSESRIRRRWLIEYHRLTNSLEDEFDASDVKKWTALHIVSAVGFQELVAALIRNGHDGEISQRDELENTPLHLAACFGRTKIAQELINKGAPINDGVDNSEETPLHMAAFGGHVEVMKLLILRGADPNATSNDIGPVVNAAISSGNREAVQLLANKGVSLTIDSNSSLCPPLALAALLSDMSMFEYLIQQYAEKLPAEEYSKALVKSAEAGRVDVFNKLLQFKHDHGYFQLALDAAVDEWNWDVVRVMLNKQPGLDCNNLFHKAATVNGDQDYLLGVAWAYSNGSISQDTVDRALYEATDCEKEHTVELLLGEPYRGNPNARGEDYGNALTAAAYDGTEDIINMLLEAGADMHDPAGWPLQTAAAQGHRDIVVNFLERGADVNAFTHDPSFPAGTALQGACEAGRVDIVRLLFEYGADPNLGGGDEGPPIIAATNRNEGEILQLLVEKKAELNIQGGWDSSTPLTNAAGCMDVSSIQLLLHNGADINLTDDDGNTALTVACEFDDDDTARVLLDNGADMLHVNKDGKNALQVALENGADDCLNLLVTQTSVLFAALRSAMEGGNMAVTSIVRTVEALNQGLDYGDEPGVIPYDESKHHSMERGYHEQVNHARQEPTVFVKESNPSNGVKSYNQHQSNSYQPLSSAYANDRNYTPFATQAPTDWQQSQWPGGAQQQEQQQQLSLQQQHTPPLPGSIPQGRGHAPPYMHDARPIQSPAIRRKPAPSTRPLYEELTSSPNKNSQSPLASPAPWRSAMEYLPEMQLDPAPQQQQQTAPQLSQKSYMPYNPHTPQPLQSSSPPYFPRQPMSSGSRPDGAPKTGERAIQGSGYYSHNPGASSDSMNYSSGGNSGYAQSPLSKSLQQPQNRPQPAYYPSEQNPYGGGWDSQQQQQQPRSHGTPPRSVLDRTRVTSSEFLRR